MSATITDLSPLLLSTGQAARRLGIGRTKLLQLIRVGRLPVRMLDGRIRIPAAAIVAFASALPERYEPGKPVKVTS